MDISNTKIDTSVNQNNPFGSSNMDSYEEDVNSDKYYTNLLIYVRFQTNIDKMNAYFKTVGLSPMINYGNMYFLKRVYATQVVDIKSLDFVEKVFEIPLTTGQSPKSIKSSDTNSNLRVYM